jgi:hypothetical protein
MSSPIRRSAPPQVGQLQGAGCLASSRGRWSGSRRRAGFCPLTTALIAGGQDWAGDGDPLGLVSFQRLDRQLELVGFALQLLRRAAKLGAPVTRLEGITRG